MSVSKNFDSKFFIVVETNKYAGNFERELCGYATGGYGDCNVGDAEAASMVEYLEENGLDEEYISGYLDYQPDDRGCSRPASIWQGGQTDDGTYGWNSVVIFLNDGLPYPEWSVFCERVRDYGREHDIVIKSIKMFARTLVVTDVEIENFRCVNEGAE